MRKSETTSLLNEKTHRMEKMQENFQSSAFYETLFNNLINHEGTQIKHLKGGDICLYLDVWREPYKVGDENKFETFMEVIVAKVENSEPLTLSETMCLNTFNDSVSYSKGSFTWSRGSMTSPRELILIDEKIFQKLRKALDVEVWTKDISYEKRHHFLRKKTHHSFRSEFRELLSSKISCCEGCKGRAAHLFEG